jgi:hypothetical protein
MGKEVFATRQSVPEGHADALGAVHAPGEIRPSGPEGIAPPLK